MSTIVGEVSKPEGIVRAINPVTGEVRVLEAGSPVFGGEIIQTSGKGGIVIDMANGTLLTLGRDTQMRLDDDVSGKASTVDSGTEGAVDIAALQQAVLEGNFDALEATAAGDAFVIGSASDGGVFVERIGRSGEVTSGFDTVVEDEQITTLRRDNIQVPEVAQENSLPTITVYESGSDNTPVDLEDNTRTVYEKGLTSPIDQSEGVYGQINFTSPDGIGRISIGGRSFTNTEIQQINTQSVEIDTGEGVFYTTTSGITGFTDSEGNFDYLPGDLVTFSIGNVEIGTLDTGTMSIDDAAFLQDIAGVGLHDLNDEYVENMAVFLQSLDANSDAYDGIVITQEMHDLFSDDSFDLSLMSETELSKVLADNGITAVTEADAMQHVKEMIIENSAMNEAEMDLINTDVTLPAITNIEMTVDSINKLGNSQNSESAIKSFDFGSEYAGQTVSLSFDATQKGNNKFDSNDKFEVNANGDQIFSISPSAQGNHEYKVSLDQNGQVELEFVVDSDSSSEFLEVSNIKVSFTEGQSIDPIDDFMLATDDADIFEITGQDDGVQINDFNIAEDTLDLSEVITDNDQQVEQKTLAEYLDFALIDSDGDGQVDDTAITIDSNDEGQRGGDKTTIFIQNHQLDENDIDDLNIDFQND